jgi:formate-dependent nitrite reductase membrane component NrfD
MIFRRVLYWSGPLGIFWIWILEELDRWLQQKWHARVLEASATRSVWFGIVAIYLIVLALAALATHRAFFFKRAAERRSFTAAWSLLPHLFLCGLLIGTSMVLGSPGVFDRLREFGLAFLSRFLFYAAVVWSLMATLDSLLPPFAAQSEKK